MMRKSRLRNTIVLMLAVLLLAGLSLPAYADCITTKADQVDDKYVTIAGNPDFYPYEYYDKTTRTYKGIFPDLYAQISEDTGIKFAYVGAGTADTRFYKTKLEYVDIVSGYVIDNEEMAKYNLSDSQGVYGFEENGQIYVIGMVFTGNISAKKEETIKNYLQGLSSGDLLGRLTPYTLETRSVVPVWVAVVPSVLLLALTVFVLVVRRKRRKAEQLQREKNGRDQLTGLKNLVGFTEAFDKLVAYQYKAAYLLAYISFDISRINTYYGKKTGEDVLKFGAEVLNRKSIRSDITARVAGGAFAAIHIGATEYEAREWIEGLLAEMNQVSEQFSGDLAPHFTAGVFCIGRSEWKADTALHQAQVYGEQALERHEDYFVGNTESARKQSMEDVVRKKLATALEKDEIITYLQPIVDLHSQKIVGAECLARWDHPELGLMRPGRFVELMIDTGNIAQLDLYLFEKICRLQEKWQQQGRFIHLSTNFTRISITSKDFFDRIKEITKKYKFDHSMITLEITEDCLEQNKKTAFDNIAACRAMGFLIALDDMGSGYTAFSDLLDYPLDIVKVDRSILLQAEEPQGRQLMEGLVHLCSGMRMKVLCEGVETKEQYQLVKSMGADMIQGFYFYAPLGVGEVERILEREKDIVHRPFDPAGN